LTEKVLVVRVGRAGDMIMITPALRAILGKHPNAEVHLLTGADGRLALRGFDARIAKTMIYERHGLGNWWQRRRLTREVATQGYTAVYCFETNPSFHTLVRGASRERYLLAPSAEVKPFPERCLQLVLGEAPKAHWLSLPVTDAGRDAARAMLASAGIDDDTFVVGLHPTFSGLRKFAFRSRYGRERRVWPIEHFARLSGLLADYAKKNGIRLSVVCDLLPDERPLGESLVAASGGLIKLLTEPPNFERYKATIARMNLLIAPNTGPMHIAAAVGTPVVALFYGWDPRDCGPYTDPARSVVLRAEEMANPESGLSAITPEVVFNACQTFLAAPAHNRASRK